MRYRALINKGGQPYAIRRAITAEGYLAANGQDAITVAENTLKAALSVPYQDLIFFHDDATPSSEVLLNAGSISGVVVTDGPTFEQGQSPDYATIRTFRFTAEAEYPYPNSQALLLSFTESLTFWGGGPFYAHRRAVNGPPVKQQIWPATEYHCTQSGVIVGYLEYPTLPAPKFPQALKEAPRTTPKAPEKRSPGRYQGYEVSYEYHFESASPLVGVPTLWI